MRSLPENEMMEELKKRLANYTEDPGDDDWDKIAAAIPKGTSSVWLKYTAVGLLFFLYSSLVWVAGRYSNIGKSNLSLINSGSITAVKMDSCEITNEIVSQEKMRQKNQPEASSSILIRKSFALNSSQDADRNRIPYKVRPAEPLSVDNNSGMNNEKNQVSEPFSSHLKNEFVPPEDTLLSHKDSLLRETDTVTVTEEIKKPKEKRNRIKPAVYFMVTPSLAFQKIVPFHNDEVLITKLNSTGVLSRERIGFTADVGLQWQLSKKILLYSGLSYYQQNASVSYSFQSQNVKEIDASGTQFSYLLSPGISSAKFSYKMRNAGVSAGLLYHLQGVKLQHKIGGGLQYQVGMLQEDGNTSFKNKGSSYLNYQILYRMEFSVHPKYHFYVQPGFTHSILSDEKLYAPMDLKTYRAGIGLGVLCYF